MALDKRELLQIKNVVLQVMEERFGPLAQKPSDAIAPTTSETVSEPPHTDTSTGSQESTSLKTSGKTTKS